MVEAELVTEYYTTDLLLTRAKLYLASGRVSNHGNYGTYPW